MIPVVAIDGPVGVGKSTVAHRVAEALDLRHLDTGAMYRAVAWRVMQLGEAERQDTARIVAIANGLRIDLPPDGRVVLDGQDITRSIRDENVSRSVAIVADIREVREALVREQRRMGAERPSVLEGRDIGTVVFPDAACKIYLDASPSVRVDRRVAQLESMGKQVDREEVFRALMERDDRDRARPWGALRIAEDARIVDSTYLCEDEVVALICELVRGNPVFETDAVAP